MDETSYCNGTCSGDKQGGGEGVIHCNYISMVYTIYLSNLTWYGTCILGNK